MPSTVDPVVLGARACVLACVTVFLGVAGHVTAEGLLPGPVVLGLLLGFTAVLCLPLLARPASALRLVVLLVGGQAAIHLVLSATAGHAGDAATAASGTPGTRSALTPGLTTALPVIDGRRVGSLQDSYEAGMGEQAFQPGLPVAHLVSDMLDHAPMMAAHLLAAALVALWLALGERCLWTLIALAGALVLRPLLLLTALARHRAGLAQAVRVRLPRAEPPGLRSPHLLTRCVVRRGPPLLA